MRKPRSTNPDRKEPHRILETQAGKHGRRFHCLACGAEFTNRADAESHEANAGWEATK